MKDKAFASLEVGLSAVIIIMVLISGFYVFTSLDEEIEDDFDDNIENVSFDFGEEMTEGEVQMINLQDKGDQKIRIIENNPLFGTYNEYIYDAELSKVYISVGSFKEFIAEDNEYPEFSRRFNQLADYVLENTVRRLEGEDLEVEEVPILGTTRIYNLQTDFPIETDNWGSESF